MPQNAIPITVHKIPHRVGNTWLFDVKAEPEGAGLIEIQIPVAVPQEYLEKEAEDGEIHGEEHIMGCIACQILMDLYAARVSRDVADALLACLKNQGLDISNPELLHIKG